MISSSGSNLAIGISLILRDQFSGKARQAGQELDKLKQRSQRAQMEAARNTNAIGAASGAAALVGMKEWVKTGAEFGKQMSYMYSIAENKQNMSIDKIKKKAMEVGANTMFSTTDVSKAMVTMAQAGQGVEQIYANINSTAILAAATMSDIHASASTMNDIMIGFNIPATEQNSMRVADIITKSINDSNIELDNFSESMKYIIPTAKTLCISLEEVAAVISAIGNAGIKGSMAGTNTENMFRYLARAAGAEKGKQVDALAQMGLSPADLRDSTGNLKSFSEIISTIGTQLKGMNNVDRVNIMESLFGVRGERPALLLAQNLENYQQFLNGVNNSQGAAQKTADAVMNGLWGTNEQLESTWENLKIVFTEAIEPVLIPLIKGLTWLINVIRLAMQTPAGQWFTIVGAGLLAVRTGIMGYRAVVLSLRLAHSTLGTSFLSSSNMVVNGYNNMTAAAARYNTTAAAGGAVAAAGGAFTTAQAMRLGGGKGYQVMGRMKNGAFRVKTPQGGYTFMSASDAGAIQAMQGRAGAMASVGKASRFGKIGMGVGKYAGVAGIAGMGLQMGAGVVGEDTGAGKAMNYVGSALSMGATGAMIGSMIAPGIGTAVGAVIGGAGGLLMTYYDYLQREKDNVDAAATEVNAQKSSTSFNVEQWKANAQKYLTMSPGQSAFVDDMGNTRMPTAGTNMWINRHGLNAQQKQPNRITINIDGRQAMDKTITDSNYEQYVNLGM